MYIKIVDHINYALEGFIDKLIKSKGKNDFDNSYHELKDLIPFFYDETKKIINWIYIEYVENKRVEFDPKYKVSYHKIEGSLETTKMKIDRVNVLPLEPKPTIIQIVKLVDKKGDLAPSP